MIEGTMKCYKCGKRSYDDNACLDEETGLLCWRSPGPRRRGMAGRVKGFTRLRPFRYAT
jgi:hypothetical protein